MEQKGIGAKGEVLYESETKRYGLPLQEARRIEVKTNVRDYIRLR